MNDWCIVSMIGLEMAYPSKATIVMHSALRVNKEVILNKQTTEISANSANLIAVFDKDYMCLKSKGYKEH